MSVTVEKGKSTATFTAKTIPVGQNTSVKVTASVGSSSASGSLTVDAPMLKSLTILPEIVFGGQNATGTLTLSGPSPEDSWLVQLQSDSVDAVVPASVKVLSGQTTATFTITTKPVAIPAAVVVTGMDDLGNKKTGQLQITQVLMPLTKGFNWTYNYSCSYAPIGSGTLSPTSQGPGSIKGISAVQLSTGYPGASFYLQQASGSGISMVGQDFEYADTPIHLWSPAVTLIPSTVVVGGTWSEKSVLTYYKPGGQYKTETYTFSGKVVAFESVTVLAGTFQGCLHVHINIGDHGSGSDDFWYAPGVGLVKANLSDQAPMGTVTGQLVLASYKSP
jgi:hypothetical protein